MSILRSEYYNFEELCEKIVKYIFTGTDAVITRTGQSKDGGYDIIASYTDNHITQRIYFECKLRNKNLSLRDIAANVIIAFNEGAVASVFFTNHNYTPQTYDNLCDFCRKTALNIKIITGNEITYLAINIDANISEKLKPFINSNKNKFDNFLSIDFNKSDIHKQFTYDGTCSQSYNNNYVPLSQLKKLDRAIEAIKNGQVIAVNGYIGIGKELFISEVLKKLSFKQININGALHRDHRIFLLNILLDVWGIPIREIIEEFTENNIFSITHHIKQKTGNGQIVKIIERLLKNNRIPDIDQARCNMQFCTYIAESISARQQVKPYVFYICNLEYASSEIQVIIIHLIRMLSENKIASIIRQNTIEYVGHTCFDVERHFVNSKNFSSIKLNIYSEEEAVEYIRLIKPGTHNSVAKHIVRIVGERQEGIDMFLSYLDDNEIVLSDYNFPQLRQLFPYNSFPTVLQKTIDRYNFIAQTVFGAIFLFNGRVVDTILYELNVDKELLTHLIKERILIYQNQYFACSNPIIWSILRERYADGSMQFQLLARQILDICDRKKIQNNEAKAYLYKYLGEYEKSLSEIEIHIEQLKEYRQFENLIDCYDIAIDLTEKIYNPTADMQGLVNQRLHYICEQLNILCIKKELLSDKYSLQLSSLDSTISKYSYLDIPQHYYIARDYFIAKRNFKNGVYDTSSNHGKILQEYYERTLRGVYFDNTHDWLGGVCYLYAISVKESFGNNAALVLFEKLSKILPDSDIIYREYNSHLGCMLLYENPEQAYNYYNLIINTFNSKRLCALPFHEYTDRAICKLLANHFDHAQNLAQDAFDICMSNGVYEECGRALNTKGCALLCQGYTRESVEIFKESIMMLRNSKYKLYLWRSQLNYVQLSLETKSVEITEIIEEFKETYYSFVTLLQGKIDSLACNGMQKFTKTREYHALLAIGLCLKKINANLNINIFSDFKINKIKRIYTEDLQKILKREDQALLRSPYYKKGRIIIVG